MITPTKARFCVGQLVTTPRATTAEYHDGTATIVGMGRIGIIIEPGPVVRRSFVVYDGKGYCTPTWYKVMLCDSKSTVLYIHQEYMENLHDEL